MPLIQLKLKIRKLLKSQLISRLSLKLMTTRRSLLKKQKRRPKRIAKTKKLMLQKNLPRNPLPRKRLPKMTW